MNYRFKQVLRVIVVVLGLGLGTYLLLNGRWWDVAVVALLVAIYGGVRLVTSWRRRFVEKALESRINDRANASYHFLRRKRLTREESDSRPDPAGVAPGK